MRYVFAFFFAWLANTFAAAAEPQSGWWWNAAEPGRGYFIEVKNGSVFAASYLYDGAGYPVWYVTGPTTFSGSGFSGSLGAYSGGQTLTGAYKTPLGPMATGNLSVSFSDATHGTITWPGGSVPITRYEIAPGSLSAQATGFRPETGWWWNADEGGRGFSLEVQGDNLFVAGFMYDAGGNPVWYVSGGKMTTPTFYQGAWLQYGGGQSLTGAWKEAKVANANVGPALFGFDSATTGTLQLPDGRLVKLKRYVFSQRTSYQNFKEIGLTPQPLPSETRWSLARGYGDFSKRGTVDLFTATMTYDPQKPIAQATPSRFEFWRKQADGSYLKDSTLLASTDGCLHPRKAVVADFNNDDRPDIFVACHGYDALPFPGERNKIVLSQPDGKYKILDASDDIGFFHGAASADLNSDGYADVLVVNNFDPQSAFVLLNQGNGTFRRESTSRIPSSMRWNGYFTVELVDVDGDGKIDLLLGGHEWEKGTPVVLLNPGSNDFSSVTPIVLPSVRNEGVVLDFTITGSAGNRAIWLLRTSGGDGTFYQSRVIQKVSWPSLESSVVLSQRPGQWIPWIIPTTVAGQKVVAGDDANQGVLVSQ